MATTNRVPLFERLAHYPDAERDQILAGVWNSFKDTDAWDAMIDMLRRLHAPAFRQLLAETTPQDRRAYAAGVAYACDLLMTTLHAVTNIDPSSFLQDPSGGSSSHPTGPSEDLMIPKEDMLNIE